MRLYDEVTEDQYKSIVRGRLAKDDFVVDDGVQGYMDNGVDDFEEAEEHGESDEDNRKAKCKWENAAIAKPGSYSFSRSEEGQNRPEGEGAVKAKGAPSRCHTEHQCL